jgi:hypothetical protein
MMNPRLINRLIKLKAGFFPRKNPTPKAVGFVSASAQPTHPRQATMPAQTQHHHRNARIEVQALHRGRHVGQRGVAGIDDRPLAKFQSGAGIGKLQGAGFIQPAFQIFGTDFRGLPNRQPPRPGDAQGQASWGAGV